MPMISLSEDFIRLHNKKIKKIKISRNPKKITLIFKKEYTLHNKDDFRRLYEDLEILNTYSLFDEIFIVKDGRVFNENEIRRIYESIKSKEEEDLNNKIIKLANIIGRLIKLVEYFKKKEL